MYNEETRETRHFRFPTSIIPQDGFGEVGVLEMNGVDDEGPPSIPHHSTRCQSKSQTPKNFESSLRFLGRSQSPLTRRDDAAFVFFVTLFTLYSAPAVFCTFFEVVGDFRIDLFIKE